MKEDKQNPLRHWGSTFFIAVLVLLLLSGDNKAPQDLNAQLNTLTADKAFNFVAWEIDAIARKLAFSLFAPQRFMNDEQRANFVLDYLENVKEARNLADAIGQAYTDPNISDPDRASAADQAALEQLRRQMRREALIAEAILSEQVSSVLNKGGFGALHQILPPVSGTFTPLPYILVISPRDEIHSIYQQQLISGLTAAEQNSLEERLMGDFPQHSAYVTGIGGLAVYPSMLLESSSIDWISDVIAHEWTHHYLLFHPLGWYYDRSNEARTINETTASLIGEWVGQEVVLSFYAPYLDREKQLPQALQAAPSETHTQRFDFRAEMHHTRVSIDRMLEDGEIAAAELYMEAQRRYFVDNGYNIRRLNQAYFAFHGAYASTPGGAAGKDPIGPSVRRLWALSPTPSDFVRQIAPATTLANVESFIQIGAQE